MGESEAGAVLCCPCCALEKGRHRQYWKGPTTIMTDRHCALFMLPNINNPGHLA